MAHSSSGLGHIPLKDETTGSNPVCATKPFITAVFVAKSVQMMTSYCGFANNLLIDGTKYNVTGWYFTLKTGFG